MAQRPAPTSSRAAVRRAKSAPVKKPFPWGFTAGAVALAALLIGTLVFAVTHTGSAAPSPLRDADKAVGNLVKAPTAELTRLHKAGNLKYAQSPPVGGSHSPIWENCAVYPTQIPNENAVHSLEHGAVWITYDPSLPAADVAKLKAKVTGDGYRLLSPYPGLKSKVSLQAWGRQVFVDTVTDKRIDTFLSKYTQGPQTPERGSACTGGTNVTGTTPAETPDVKTASG